MTGSSFLITSDQGNTLLVDCGTFQGSEEIEKLNYQPIQYPINSLQGVCITHAHLDHCGRLPVLTKAGYKGPIYMTRATRDIVQISLLDSAKIAKEDEQGEVLFTEDDVAAVISQIETVTYGDVTLIGDFEVAFYNAGHILGSASITVRETENDQQKLVVSGDLGNTPQDLIKPTEYIETATSVVMETTYGDKMHGTEDAVSVIQEEINTIEENFGVLLIPAFSIERTQELLHIIGHLKAEHKIQESTPVYLDSPMAIRVTDVFEKYRLHYNQELSQDSTPFSFPQLQSTLSSQDSKDILKQDGAKVIIAGSGMMSGGRILYHLQNYIDRETTRILIVGYQAEDTLGREIEEGATEIELNGQTLPVLATVNKLDSLSAHADQGKLMTWLSHIKGVREVFLVHGEMKQRQLFAEKIDSELDIERVELPNQNETYPLT